MAEPKIAYRNVGLYAPDPPTPAIVAAIAGFKSLGCNVLMRNPRHFGDSPSEFAGEEVCVVTGLNRTNTKIVDSYRRWRPNVPILNIEKPFLAKRTGGEWARVAPAESYWMPRRAREGVELSLVPAIPPIPEDGVILLLGFAPLFPGNPNEAEATALVHGWLAAAWAKFGRNAKAWYRPHPAQQWIPPGLPSDVEIDRRVSDGPCAAMASIVASRCVVADRSAAGMWAAMLGRPVICGSNAFYASAATTWHEMKPNRDEAMRVALRAASAEWPLAQIANGDALRWLDAEMSAPTEWVEHVDNLVATVSLEQLRAESVPVTSFAQVEFGADLLADGNVLSKAGAAALDQTDVVATDRVSGMLAAMRDEAPELVAQRLIRATPVEPSGVIHHGNVQGPTTDERIAWKAGADAKAAKLAISSCPHRPRSAHSVAWRKGWQGEAL